MRLRIRCTTCKKEIPGRPKRETGLYYCQFCHSEKRRAQNRWKSPDVPALKKADRTIYGQVVVVAPARKVV